MLRVSFGVNARLFTMYGLTMGISAWLLVAVGYTQASSPDEIQGEVVCELGCCANCPGPNYPVVYPYDGGGAGPQLPIIIYGLGESNRWLEQEQPLGGGDRPLEGNSSAAEHGATSDPDSATVDGGVAPSLVDFAGTTTNNLDCPFPQVVYCRTPPQPPGTVNIDCVQTVQGSYFCQVYPLGSVTYTWNTTGTIHTSVPAPYAGASQEIWCSGSPGGQLTVIVTSPYNVSSQSSRYLSCSGM